MNKLLLASFLILVGLQISCAESRSTPSPAKDAGFFDGPRPIAVLIQTDPWKMVIGSDTPLIAIYDDGQVIQLQREDDQAPRYMHQQLSSRELSAVRQRIASFGSLSEIKGYYDVAPNVTDMPETEFYLDLGERKLATTVYGLMVPKTQLPAYTVFPGEGKPDQLPQVLTDLHEYLMHFHCDGSKPWTPRFVEVMIWPYEYAPDESIHWPDKWPGLDSPSALEHGDSYSIFLPGLETTDLQEFLKKQEERGAVEIGGKKWAVSYRNTFPGEPVWFQALKQAEETSGKTDPTDSGSEAGP